MLILFPFFLSPIRIKIITFKLCIFVFFKARAAKEAEFQQILKGPPKRLNINNNQQQQTSPHSQNHHHHLRQQSPNHNTSNITTSPQNRISLPNVPALQYMSLQQKALLNPLSTNITTNDTQVTNQHRTRTASPLDLSSSMPINKKMKRESPSPNQSVGSPTTVQLSQQQHPPRNQSNTSTTATSSSTMTTSTQRRCHAQTDEINSWSVNQVCDFVGSIDICAEYVEVNNF